MSRHHVSGNVRDPTFAVLVPTHDRPSLVTAAVDSALSQTHPGTEVIVADDRSGPDTAAALSAFGKRIHMVRLECSGLGAARNRAAAAARSDYLVFLDDDLLPPWALATYRDVVRSENHPAVVMGRAFRFAHDRELERLEATEPHYETWPDFFASASARNPVTVCAAVRRDALESIGGFLEHPFGSEDIDLFMRLGRAPGFVFIEAPDV